MSYPATWENFFNPSPFYVDANGNPLIGAKLYFYESGTDTLLDTYTDSTLEHANDNPVVSVQPYGMFPPIYLSGAAYKIVLKDANNNQIFVRDPVQGGVGSIPYPIFSTDTSVKYVASPYTTVLEDWGKTLCLTASGGTINFNAGNPNGWNVTVKNTSAITNTSIVLPAGKTIDGVAGPYALAIANYAVNPAVDANGNYVIRNTVQQQFSQYAVVLTSGTLTASSVTNVLTIPNFNFPGANFSTNQAMAICSYASGGFASVAAAVITAGATSGITLTLNLSGNAAIGDTYYYQIWSR